MKKELSTLQNTVYNTLGSGFYLVCTWVITVLAVRLGSVEAGGVLSLAMSVTNIFYTLSVFGVRTYQVSDYDRKYETGDYTASRLITGFAALALCAGYSFLSPEYSRYEAACVTVYMLFRTGEAFSDENQALQQVAGRMDYVCWSFLIRGVCVLGSFIAAFTWTGSLLWAFGAMAASTGLAVLLFEVPVSRTLAPGPWRFRPAAVRSLLKENLPLLANTLIMVLMVSWPRTRLNALWGNYWMGIYGSVAAPAAIMQSAALWLFLPSLSLFARYWSEGDRRAYDRLHRRIMLLLGGLSAAVLLGAWLLGRWGLNLLFGAEIASHAGLLLPTLVTTILIAGEYYLASLLTAARKMKAIVISNLAGLGLTFLLADPLIRPYGAEGVNLTVCLAMGVNCVLLYGALLQARRRHFGKEEKQAG